MPSDKSAVIVGHIREPKYRADCVEWFHDFARETATIQLSGPHEVLAALEHAAERAGRRFNDQLFHVLRACQGRKPLDFADTRTVSEWRELMGKMDMQFREGEEWIPCSVLFPRQR